VASGFNANGTAAKNIMAAGYRPDIVSGATSLWTTTRTPSGNPACQWQKRLDPTYNNLRQRRG